MEQAIALYRARFQPSAQLAIPRVMLGLNVCAADTDAEARRLFSSHQQALIARRTGRRGPLPPPLDTGGGTYTGAGSASIWNAAVGDHGPTVVGS